MPHRNKQTHEFGTCPTWTTKKKNKLRFHNKNRPQQYAARKKRVRGQRQTEMTLFGFSLSLVCRVCVGFACAVLAKRCAALLREFGVESIKKKGFVCVA